LQILANSKVQFPLKCYVFTEYLLVIRLVVVIMGLVFVKHTNAHTFKKILTQKETDSANPAFFKCVFRRELGQVFA
jgi:hypothetical protein